MRPIAGTWYTPGRAAQRLTYPATGGMDGAPGAAKSSGKHVRQAEAGFPADVRKGDPDPSPALLPLDRVECRLVVA